MVALPGQLFYSTQIPVCLWFLAKHKNADARRGFRDRRQQTLFIDARKMGTLIDRVHRELTDDDLMLLTGKKEVFLGKLQERTGLAKDEAEKQLDVFISRLAAETKPLASKLTR